MPIYYESRISKLSLNAAELPKIDEEFEEITEGEELTKKEKLKTKWAALEALVGDPKRIALVAVDLVAHFEKRVEAMDGKAMIVCMSRRICVDLYNALIKLRPEWEAETLKVVMTGSAEDGPEWQKHIGNKKQRRKLANRFKDAKDPFKIVIVRDMWPGQMANDEWSELRNSDFCIRTSPASRIGSRRRSSPTPRAAARGIRPSTPRKPSP